MLLVRLHLHLLHPTLQLAVGLLQVVVVSEGPRASEGIRSPLPETLHPFPPNPPLVCVTGDAPCHPDREERIHSPTASHPEFNRIEFAAHRSSSCSLSSSSWMRLLSLETTESWLALCDPSRWDTRLFRSLFWWSKKNKKQNRNILEVRLLAQCCCR